jgi:hypothetical protein
MKTSRIVLAEWVSHDLYIDIDWPAVQKKLGLEQLEWLLSQPADCCQLVLDQCQVNNHLVAEFYSQETLVTYLIMWGHSSPQSTCEAGVRRFFKH